MKKYSLSFYYVPDTVLMAKRRWRRYLKFSLLPSNICWLTRFYWLFRETHQLVGKHNISFLLLFGNSSHPRILPPHFWESSKLSQTHLRIILLYSKVSQPFLAEIESWEDEAFVHTGIKNWKWRLERWNIGICSENVGWGERLSG